MVDVVIVGALIVGVAAFGVAVVGVAAVGVSAGGGAGGGGGGAGGGGAPGGRKARRGRRRRQVGNEAKDRVCGASQLGLDLGESVALRLAPLDRDQLEQMARAVKSGAPAHGTGPVNQPDGGVPPDHPAIRQLRHAAVGG